MDAGLSLKQMADLAQAVEVNSALKCLTSQVQKMQSLAVSGWITENNGPMSGDPTARPWLQTPRHPSAPSSTSPAAASWACISSASLAHVSWRALEGVNLGLRFACLLVFEWETAKIQELFSNFNILFSTGEKQIPTIQVIATPSIHRVRFPSRFLIFQGWKERLPLGPTSDPSIMWTQCMHIHSTTSLSLLEWLWHGYHESILRYSPIFIVNSTEIRRCLPLVSKLNGPLTALPLKHKLHVPRH